MKQLKKSFGLVAAAFVMLTVSCQTQHELVKPIQYNFLEDLDPDSVLMLCPPPFTGQLSNGVWNGNLIRYEQYAAPQQALRKSDR
ncbi:hypothetical protein ACFOTA_19850 [Chitinophaga sp. GCM10012297]|uniref:Uncharacterized protein n=1 Tax=Chitinophaga chungangae TaxID=2821488 RepID=A0ABS3YII7_9BACT|nr:hypothetical protein [Chitinophaga chungangae]MBO9154477.1 hypothetical protein [Chitinophaga chungangae]